MTNLEAFALRATGSQRILAAPAFAWSLASPAVGVGKHVGITGDNPEERTRWIHVAMPGEWAGHPNGSFKLTSEVFAQCIAALRERETPPMLDYEHASLRPLDGQPTPAAGYVLDLEERGDGFYALVELTKRAAAMVDAGEYRFNSGVFVWGAPDERTGEPIPCQLDSIALTNRPFIDGQHAIRLSRRIALGASMEIKKSDLMAKLDALVSGATVTGDEIKALVEFLEKSGGMGEPEPSGEVEVEAEMSKSAPLTAAPAAPLAAPPMAPMADAPVIVDVPVDPMPDAAAAMATKLAELTGLDNVALLASIDANADAIKQAFLGSAPAAALSADIKDQTIAALSREVNGYRVEAAKRADAELAAEVEALVGAGKALPSQRTQMLALAKASPAQFRALASTMPVIVPMGKDVPPETPPTNANELGGPGLADTLPKTDARYVALAKTYENGAWSRLLPTDPTKRAEAIDRLVRGDLKRQQPISG